MSNINRLFYLLVTLVHPLLSQTTLLTGQSTQQLALAPSVVLKYDSDIAVRAHGIRDGGKIYIYTTPRKARLNVPGALYHVMTRAEADRLRISRFEHECTDLTKIAIEAAQCFNVDVAVLQKRQRGGAASDAWKVFAFGACRVYGAPVSLVRSFLGVGAAAVSAMVLQGREITEKHGVFK